MKIAFVVFVIGDKYINNFNSYFKNNLELYCKKYNYELIILSELLRQENNMDNKKFYWQRLLIADKFREYDFVVSIDSDIYINVNSPEFPFKEIPEGKVAAVNERKYLGCYELREKIQQQMNWEKTGKDWHALSGEIRDYNDHINGGLVVYQPKYHADKMLKLYNDNIGNYMKYHQDDQSILSLYFIDNDMIYWLDERFNRIWFFWKYIKHPNFNRNNNKKDIIKDYINQNYFCHFTSGTDIQYI